MKLLAILFVSFALVNCNQKTADNFNAPALNVDSLTAVFLAGWNNHDSAAIMKTITDNAIVMNDSVIHKGHSTIASNWVSGGVKVLGNIKTSSVINGNDAGIAYDGGTYTLDLTPPGGPILKEKGNYNLIWTKQLSGEWKLSLVHIEDITRMPDIK